MNEAAIIKILKKRKPNGTDLGRLFFFINMLTCANREITDPKNIDMMRQYLGRYINNLTVEQAEIYVSFSGLYNIVCTYNYLGQGYYQQALRCFYRIMLIVGNAPIFIGIESMDDEFDIENVKADIRSFITALKKAFAIDQFFIDIEKKFKLDGVVEVYAISDTLAECVKSYNDVVKRLEEMKLPEYNDLLSYLFPISIDSCLPTEENIKAARKRLKSINVFQNQVSSTEFFDEYISEK